MKRYYFVFFLMIYFCSCQDASEDGFGYLQLSSVELNKAVIPNTKAVGGEAVEKIALDLMRGETVVKHVDDWTLLKGESLLLPTGSYVVKAYSADKNRMSAGFEGFAYYAGQAEVVVEKNVAKSVEILKYTKQ